MVLKYDESDAYDRLTSSRCEAVGKLVGKTISQIVMKRNKHGAPRCQLLIVFTDNMVFEFFTEREMIVPSKGVCSKYILESDGDTEDAVVTTEYTPERTKE